LVCEELAILPNSNDVGNDKNGGVLVDIFAAGFGDVRIIAVNFDGRTCNFATINGIVSDGYLTCENWVQTRALRRQYNIQPGDEV
jgi:hypothetical protein